MRTIIFSGPTLTADKISTIIQADCRPPAKQGDLYLATHDKPDSIVLIDGYFESVPAVWHKEILYAISLGINVYGCSSMGALRAAELSSLGMKGFGFVFEQFHSGHLEDDDEVALVHGPAELGYPSLSTPMINIRATLDAAVAQHIIGANESAQLVLALKELHYPKRSFDILKQYAKKLMDKAKSQPLCDFIDCHPIDIKQQDALSLLQSLASSNADKKAPNKDRSHFAKTDAWERLVSKLDQQRKLEMNSVTAEELDRELKLEGRYHEYKQQAIARKAALRSAVSHLPDTNNLKKSTLLELAFHQSALEKQKLDFPKLAHWANSQQISSNEFDRLVETQSLLAWLDHCDHQTASEMLDILKLTNQFAEYQKKIEFKRAYPPQPLSDLALTEQELWDWYIARKQNTVTTKDPNDLYLILGFTSRQELAEAIAQDYHYYLQKGAK
ncbi:TfuA-like protein [Photobacterium alginatilyticum]|uniref:TfuA-like protein n=1 Tax=Photobacterium alginatilyticum TaxID=1775171 RepID=UPI0040698184